MFRIDFFLATLVVVTAAAAQTPIPRVGDDCPTGTYKSGDYCIPTARSDRSGEKIIVEQGADCPIGFYKSGLYCKQFSGRNKEAIPRESGNDCPTG